MRQNNQPQQDKKQDRANQKTNKTVDNLASLETYQHIIAGILISIHLQNPDKDQSIMSIKGCITRLTTVQRSVVKIALKSKMAHIKHDDIPDNFVTDIVDRRVPNLAETPIDTTVTTLVSLVDFLLDDESLYQYTVNAIGGLYSDDLGVLCKHSKNPIVQTIGKRQDAIYEADIMYNVTHGLVNNRWNVDKKYVNSASKKREKMASEYMRVDMILRALNNPNVTNQEWFIQQLINNNKKFQNIKISPNDFITMLQTYVDVPQCSRRVIRFLRGLIKRTMKEYEEQFKGSKEPVLLNIRDRHDFIPLEIDGKEDMNLVAPCVTLNRHSKYTRNIKYDTYAPNECKADDVLFKVKWNKDNKSHMVYDNKITYYCGVLQERDAHKNMITNKNAYEYRLQQPGMGPIRLIQHNLIVTSNIKPSISQDAFKYTYIYKGKYGVTPCYVSDFNHPINHDDLVTMQNILKKTDGRVF